MTSPPAASEDSRRAIVRWGVLGTANIAAKAFLPALHEAGGRAMVVGSRSPGHAADWAAAQHVGRIDSYAGVLSATDVDVVYVALPNDQHAMWVGAAIAAGKAVLCEKPLALDGQEAAELLRTVGEDALLWEAFVFPFHPQTELIVGLISAARIGDLREIVAEFHFEIGRPNNIRLQLERGGGALYDVGCYPIRLARLLFRSEPLGVVASASYGDQLVDMDVAAVLDFPRETRLIMSAGMRRPPSTFTRIVGSEGELRISNPFHPRPHDTVELWLEHECTRIWHAAEGTAFRYAIEHINDVVGSGAPPRYRVIDDSLPQARALDLVRLAIAKGGVA